MISTLSPLYVYIVYTLYIQYILSYILCQANEKNFYLGEFRENVISALRKQDIDENIQYRFLNLMKNKNANEH